MEAMKAKDTVRLGALRNAKKYIIEAKTAGPEIAELPDADVLKIISKLAKQGADSAAIFTEQNRPDLAAEELAQVAVFQEYLPRLGTIRRYFASFCQYSSRYDKFRQGIVLNAFNPELSNGAMMDIGVYTVYPMVALFGRPLEVEAQGIVLSSGADGQGVVNFRYEGMNATVLYSKIANSSLPTEIQGEEGNLLLDAIHTIRDVAYLPRPAAASGRGDAPVRHSVGLPLEKDTYYYEVAEFIDLIEQGRIESTVNSHENSLVTMEIIDQVRRQLGVSYPADRLP